MYKEIIIPEIKIYNGGIQKNSNKNKKPVIYNNQKNSKKDSDIILTSSIYLNQDVIKYMNISDKINPLKSEFNKVFFRSIIIEVQSNEIKHYFMIPVEKNNKFTGYIYFRTPGRKKISLYLFYDYLSYKGSKLNNVRLKSKTNTMASILFYVNVLEAVPQYLHYLLPSKNVDCGNKKLREFTDDLVKNSSTDIEKTRKIYEFIVFGNHRKNNKLKFKKYETPYNTKVEFDYHNTYTASQVLFMKHGICNDFSELFTAMMRSQGYKVKKVWGYYDEKKTIGHMWNIVDLTGDETQWINIDATWGNQDKKNYKKWAEIYPEFDKFFFDYQFKPYNHKNFNYQKKIEY